MGGPELEPKPDDREPGVVDLVVLDQQIALDLPLLGNGNQLADPAKRRSNFVQMMTSIVRAASRRTRSPGRSRRIPVTPSSIHWSTSSAW